jgi:hypothetical protein
MALDVARRRSGPMKVISTGLFALYLAAPGAAVAASIEALQGAWAMDGTDCTAVFEKKGNEIRFRDPGSSLDTGVIISGSKVVGPSATCTTAKVREEGDHFSVLLNCSDAVLSSTVSMSFRIVDASHFERFDPSFPEFSLAYVKCPF